MRPRNSGSSEPPTLACSWDSFLLSDCLVQPPYEGVCLVPSFAVLCCCLLEGYYFLKGNGEGESGGGGRWEGAGRNEGRGNCGWDVLLEKRIYFQLKKRRQYRIVTLGCWHRIIVSALTWVLGTAQQFFYSQFHPIYHIAANQELEIASSICLTTFANEPIS